MAEDFMPLLGWDHIELWVGNAKQAAYFYEHAMGFTQTAYAGPETGVRDRASYVLEQGDVRFVVTSALREEHEITKHHARHGDGVRDIALTVPDATQAYREAVSRGARSVMEPRSDEDEFGKVERSAIATYGDTIHTFVNRDDYGGPFLPGYVSVSENGHADPGVGLLNLDHVVAFGNVGTGINASSGAAVRLYDSTINNNGMGLSNTFANILSFGLNRIAGNTTDGSPNGTIPVQ